jgi:hypothetical protein
MITIRVTRWPEYWTASPDGFNFAVKEMSSLAAANRVEIELRCRGVTDAVQIEEVDTPESRGAWETQDRLDAILLGGGG